MPNYRKHGKPPFNTILVHGGPGAVGDLFPLAKELGKSIGVIEALQTKNNIPELIIELDEIINSFSNNKIVLTGHSWGAWLCYLYAAAFPEKVQKVIMISSGSLIEYYANDLLGIRAKRLKSEQRTSLSLLMNKLNKEHNPDKQNQLFKTIGSLFSLVDSYNLIEEENPESRPDYAMYKNLWPEAIEFRQRGDLYAQGIHIKCDICIIHGNYDPHSFRGVAIPLFQLSIKTNWYYLEKCGHSPWKEKYAKEKFYEIIKEEINSLASICGN